MSEVPLQMQGRSCRDPHSWSTGIVGPMPLERESSLLTTYWSESTTSNRCLGWPALRHGIFEFPFPCSLISTFLCP